MADEWDGIGSEEHGGEALHEGQEAHEVPPDGADEFDRPAPPGRAPVTARVKKNSKLPWLLGGFVVMLALGGFGYYKYKVQVAQQLQMQQKAIADQRARDDAARQKTEADKKAAADAAAAGGQGVADAGQPVAGTGAPSVVNGAPQDSAHERSGVVVNPGAAVSAAAPAPAPQTGQAAPTASPAGPTVSGLVTQQGQGPAQTPSPSQPAAPAPAPVQASPARNVSSDYVGGLEMKVGELTARVSMLERELCTRVPSSSMCPNAAREGGREAPPPKQERAPIAKNEPGEQRKAAPEKKATAKSGSGDRVVLFGDASQDQAPSRRQVAFEEGAPKVVEKPVHALKSGAQASGLNGIAILPDRVVYRDKNGSTREAEVGQVIEGIGRLEAINFDAHTFQANGAVYY